MAVWREYNENAFIDYDIFEEIESINQENKYTHVNYGTSCKQENIENSFYYFLKETNNINFNYLSEITELQKNYREIFSQNININFKGFSCSAKINIEKFRCKFNSFVLKLDNATVDCDFPYLHLWPLSIIITDTWKFILDLPDYFETEKDFLLFICLILKDAKNKTISEIFQIFQNNEFNEIFSHQLCDLLYNNFYINSFEKNIFCLLKPIS